MKTEYYDIAVIGGGMSGITAAIAAARGGATTVLVHDRPVLGGNASSEIRMHICGADGHAKRPNARETGIIEELLLENKFYNPENSYGLFDMVLWGKIKQEKNLTLHLNTHMLDAKTSENRIKSVMAVQLTQEGRLEICAKLFVDATGDGTLGYYANAEFMYGRECSELFDEPDAKEKNDNCTMGNSLLFTSKDMGYPVKHPQLPWANNYSEEDLALRNHEEITSGYWWIELGGNRYHTINDAEKIRDELVKSLAGVWKHIKEGKEHGAERYELDWVGFLPGKRESRRLLGDYVLNENDCVAGRIFEDAVAYGGWSIDDHIIDGIEAKSKEPTHYTELKDLYTIPYRCLYSYNINNLFLAGRAISCSHLAFASTRVMGTCSVVGQAVGTAAAMAIRKQVEPRQIGKNIVELQQQLMKDNCYIPGFRNQDNKDLLHEAQVYASSRQTGFEEAQVLSGIARQVGDESNCWRSQGIRDGGEWLHLFLDTPSKISELRLSFDSNLNREITISISQEVLKKQLKGTPRELIRSYRAELLKQGNVVESVLIEENHQRMSVISFHEPISCDSLRLTFFSTYGAPDISVFEVRGY